MVPGYELQLLGKVTELLIAQQPLDWTTTTSNFHVCLTKFESCLDLLNRKYATDF
jgi:hypothetical protein